MNFMDDSDEYMDATLQINAFGLSAGGLRLFPSWGTSIWYKKLLICTKSTWYTVHGYTWLLLFFSLNQFISLLVEFPYEQIGVKGALSETSTSTREQRNQVLQTTWTLETRPLFTEVSDFGDQKSYHSMFTVMFRLHPVPRQCAQSIGCPGPFPCHVRDVCLGRGSFGGV